MIDILILTSEVFAPQCLPSGLLLRNPPVEVGEMHYFPVSVAKESVTCPTRQSKRETEAITQLGERAQTHTDLSEVLCSLYRVSPQGLDSSPPSSLPGSAPGCWRSVCPPANARCPCPGGWPNHSSGKCDHHRISKGSCWTQLSSPVRTALRFYFSVLWSRKFSLCRL